MNKDSNYYESLFDLLKRTMLSPAQAEKAKMAFDYDETYTSTATLIAKYTALGYYVFFYDIIGATCDKENPSSGNTYDLVAIMYASS